MSHSQSQALETNHDIDITIAMTNEIAKRNLDIYDWKCQLQLLNIDFLNSVYRVQTFSKLAMKSFRLRNHAPVLQWINV